MSHQNEASTRKELIDPALLRAGWDVNNHDQVGIEIPVDGFDPQAWAVLNKQLNRIRQHRLPLSQAVINTTITDRLYQQEAIRRVCEAFEQHNRRKALLVMATGTGKTRTVMSIIDIFLRANQAKNTLFVADRDALVEQAISDGFKKHLPNEPHERIFTHALDTTKRLYAITLQSLNLCFQTFTPAFFDLIIFDEVHRSIFNKWNKVLQYFDARLIGLTATRLTLSTAIHSWPLIARMARPLFSTPSHQTNQDTRTCILFTTTIRSNRPEIPAIARAAARGRTAGRAPVSNVATPGISGRART